MRQRYMDAIALVQHFGKPDLFFYYDLQPKLAETYLNCLILEKRKVSHKLGRREYKLLTTEAYDEIISAELPDITTDKCLHLLVLKHMMHGSDSYPIYKRRNIGKVVEIRGQYLDTSWVDLYNPFLLDSDTNKEIDEIKEFQSARWAWRLFGFSISEMCPTVCHLQRKTMLTEFFEMNRTNKNAQELKLLQNVTLRKQRFAIGHPTEGEHYYLRLVLRNVRGPKSYDDLQTRKSILSLNNKIKLPASLIVPFTTEEESLDTLFTMTFSNLHTSCSNSSSVDSRVILTTKNDFVNEINDMLIAMFSEKATTYICCH
ncbi:hypothetical protein H5410_027168 [Solanum commersonii]|uniref:ATP-dependent DNA helicase n=1 Tax=Solanum commersonii TaxID=4109 RepID=A0A9J5Z2M8_SOLCO|nr:hypothetical protein H5410_027168 [Solanum commersonii]